ncbi:MAG: hypothetical protein R2855_10035 [Thermomicrobiales bacterium]
MTQKAELAEYRAASSSARRSVRTAFIAEARRSHRFEQLMSKLGLVAGESQFRLPQQGKHSPVRRAGRVGR